MGADTIVGLLTLLGLAYVVWLQTDLRRSEVGANDADTLESSAGAVSQITAALMQAVEAVASRDARITELRERIEILEASDRRKARRIAELEKKINVMEVERQRLLAERDHLAQQLEAVSVLPETMKE